MRRAAALAAAALLSGCGGDNGADVTPANAQTSLSVTTYPNGIGGDSLTWTLTCDPTGGTHPDPEPACAALAAVQDPFGPVKKRRGCEEIPGGPEATQVEGTYRGKRVKTTFTRENLCTGDRWDRIADFFPLAPA